ncbi:MAG: hypothetical protein WD960_14040 [Gemmatimonadota bacterium]
MWTLGHSLVMLAAVQIGVSPPDTASTLEQASELIYRYYDSLRPGNQAIVPCRRGEADGACVDQRVGPTSQVSWVDPCRGTGFAECLQGDWDCSGPVRGDCLEPHLRADLIDRLEALAPEAGASIWLYQQRVGMAVKHGDLEHARQTAHECGSIDWFCPALRGFVEHRNRLGDGLAQFDSALALAPEDVRCYWRDPSPIWGQRPSADCPTDMDERRLVWWLSDPLWTTRANEREAEHLSRQVIRWISWGARSSRYRPLWQLVETRAAEELQYSRPGIRMLMRGPFNTVEHLATPSRLVWVYETYGGHSFTPTPALVEDPLRSSPSDWEVRWDRGEERMFITENWQNLDHQAVVLRRGSELRVLAAAEVPASLASPIEAGLAVGRPDDLAIFTTSAAVDPSGNVRADILVDDGDYMGSVEVVAGNGIGRAREGLPIAPLQDGFGLSHSALVEGGEHAEDRELAQILLPATTFSRDDEVALYFEIYGAEEDELLEIRLAVDEDGGSVWGRITSFFGRSDSPVSLEWEEPVSPEAVFEGSVVPRIVDLDLRGLSAGDYRLVVEVQRADGDPVESVRRFRIVD